MEDLAKAEKEVREFPDEVMLDILSRLDVKTACQLRCVSKLWRQYLSDPYFFKLHHQREKPCLLSLVLLEGAINLDLGGEFEKTIELYSRDNTGRYMNKFTQRVRSDKFYPFVSLLPSNGNLICLATQFRIYLCNPSTQQFVQLKYGYSSSVGFGYLPATEEYKVVRLHLEELSCEVLTLGGRNLSTTSPSWRILKELFPWACPNCNPVFVQGSLYWTVSVSAYGLRSGYIVSLDLGAEKFGRIRGPLVPLGSSYSRPVEISGNLWVSDYAKVDNILHLWKLKDWDDFEWVREYNINIKPVILPTMQGVQLVDIPGNKEIFISMKIIGLNTVSLHQYNIKEKTFTVLDREQSQSQLCYYTDGFFPLQN